MAAGRVGIGQHPMDSGQAMPSPVAPTRDQCVVRHYGNGKRHCSLPARRAGQRGNGRPLARFAKADGCGRSRSSCSGVFALDDFAVVFTGAGDVGKRPGLDGQLAADGRFQIVDASNASWCWLGSANIG
jgi:hypothetical protein